MNKADEVLDCLGLQCPMPIIKTAEKIKEIGVGRVLEIISDDPGIEEDIPNWCKATGHKFLGIEKDDDEFHAFVEKTH
ncbi:MAG: sulfurtransferase TusA family protein [Calditrichaeota bacterium]|nr:sulfurtransferase TusA family protein [Calditrichota bacterium]